MTEAPKPDDLVEELTFLRKNDGFSSARLERVELLPLLLRQAETDSFGQSRSRFISAIQTLGDADTALLLDVFGLSSETEGHHGLDQRRRIYANRIGRSAATVADREGAALVRLARVIITGRYAQSPLTLNVPEMHGGLVYESTSTLLVVRDRMWVETQELYRFVAEFDEMDYLAVTRSYDAQASVSKTGRFRVNTRATSNGYNDYFWHVDPSGADEPMYRGKRYELRFRLTPTDRPSSTPMVSAYRAFHERALLASIQVVFVGERPSVVWKYERVSHFDQPGGPTKENQVLVDERGGASVRLRDVYGGLVSGLAWRWQRVGAF